MSLSPEQRKHLEERLKEERDRALRALNQAIEENSAESEQDRAGDLTAFPFHPADRGTDTMQTELEASIATRVSRELAEIDRALERLYQEPEKYGICENTGQDIPFERLDIVPWARTCE